MTDQEQFTNLCKKTFEEQAVWFLNGFWNDGANPEVANVVWKVVKEFIKLDLMSSDPKGDSGNELDQFWSAKFLEDNDEPMTQIARKEALKAIDQDNNGKMSCLEYLIWKYNKTVEQAVNAPQGSLTEEQQRELEATQESLERLAEALTRLQAAEEDLKKKQQELKEKQAELAATQRELAAKQAELDKTVADLKALEAEQQAAVEAFEEEERKYKGECDRLRALSEDSATSAVQRSKASVQLQALLAEDPLPLRKAKITQEAVVRRVQKEQAPLLEALAQQKAGVAEQQEQVAQHQASVSEQEKQVEQQKEAVVAEQQSVLNQMDEAHAKIEKLKSMGGVARGALWWMERKMFEADERLARAKQRYDHSKPFFYDPK